MMQDQFAFEVRFEEMSHIDIVLRRARRRMLIALSALVLGYAFLI